MAEATSKREIKLIWLPNGRKAKLADFAAGADFDELESAVVRAAQATPQGTQPWICCDGKFVMGPEDIAMAFGQLRQGG